MKMKIAKIKISDEVNRVLEAAVIDGNTLKIVEQLDRDLYVQVNKVLEGIGGKWNRKAKAHIFPSDPREIIWQIVEDKVVEIVDEKKTYQFFRTPVEVIKLMIDYADIEVSHRVLEPSAGDGAILKELFYAAGMGKVAVELNSTMAAELRTKFPLTKIVEGDFLECNGSLGTFDRIIMNPPFTGGQDIAHIKHAMKFLNPGGRIVAICANGSKQTELLKPLATIWEELPEDAFKESGTGVRTVLLTIEKGWA